MMKKRKAWNKAIALLCAATLLFSVFPAGNSAAETAEFPAPHSGTQMLRGDLKGDAGNWAYMEQEVDGIAANTDYSFGMWVKGDGIATLKVSAGGATVSYTRPIATGEWTYHSVNFNSGSRSGKMTFSIVDSAATAYPQSTAAGVMYVDDVYLGTSGGGANLLQNAGFEAGMNLWNKLVKDVFSVVEGASVPEEPGDPEDPPVDTTVYKGVRSLKAELAAKSSGWAYLTQKVTGIAAGMTYELGMWVKGAGAATLKLSQGSSSGGALAFVRQKATGSWTYWAADYTAATNEDLHVSIYDSAYVPGSGITQAEAQGIMRIDDVFFGVKGSGVNRLANSGFEASDALTNWTVASNSSPLVFSVAGGAAEHETPGGPIDPVDPTDPVDPVDPGEPGNPDDPANIYAGSRSMQAATKGKPNDWKTVTQQIGGIAAGTDYKFGAWLRGSGAVTIKVAKSNGENLHYIRPKATNTWTYASASFNSGTYTGTVVFSIVDSAGAAYPQAEAAGTMYADEAFFGAAAAGSDNLLLNPGFEQQLKYWGGDKGDVFTRYPDRSDNPPAQQYDGVDNLGVYSWDRNPDGVADFGEWIGRMPALAEDFLEQNTWSDLEGGNRLAAWEGTPFADRMIWAAYPFPKSGGSLAASANGDYNDHYRQLGENLVAAGMENAMIRFGHEFNGGWYIWSIGNANDPNHLQKAENFAEAFRQFVTTLRDVEGQNFKFVWNPSTSIWGVDLEAAFPGRDYVDFIGIDHYDQTWAQSGGKPLYGPEYRDADATERLRRQELAWNAQVNDGNWGLNMIARFAEDQGVPLGICEWGLALRAEDGMGGGDNPYFIQKMYEWIENNNVAWHVYFNVSASDGDHDLYDTVAFPESSAKFAELWHPDGAPNTSPAIAPSDIPGIGGDYVKIEGEDGVLAGPVNKLHGDPWASGGQFAVMYRSVNSLTFANANKADDGIAIVYQGWQSDQKASLYVNNVLVKPNILFEEHGRSWSDSYGYVVIDDVQIPDGATVKLQINPDDVMDNWDNFKVDYILLLGATGEYEQPEEPGEGGGIGNGADAVSVPSRTSFTRSGVWSLTADVKGSGNTNGSSYSAQPTLTAGVTYEFGAWIKGSGRMALVIQNTTSWAEVLAKPFAATDEWQFVSATYTPAASGKYNIKVGDRDNSGTAGRIYVDDVRLSPLGGDPVIDENFEDGGARWWHPAGHFAPIDYSSQGDSTDAHSGSWSMKLDAAAGEAGTAAVLSSPLLLAAGKPYTFKAYVKGDAAFSVRISEAGKESQVPAEESFEDGTGDWNEVSFSFIAEQTGDYELSLVSADDTGVLYLDDMLLFTDGFNNLLPNPDFEQGNVHWETDGAFVILNMDEIEMPDAAPVTANPDSGNIVPGQLVALSTTESGGAIYYTIAGSAAKSKYEAPIRLNGTTSITAWTEIDGKRKSPVRTFSYVNAEDLLVDSYGQIRSAEFPGKIHSDVEFAAAAESDHAFLESLTAPGDRDAYGGLAGSKGVYGFEETGYFHIEKLNGKSVMVNPLGNLYFHLAVNGTGYVDETSTVVGGRESVYEWLPFKSGEFATAYDGSGNFSFYIANEIRRTGVPFDQARYSADSVDFVKSLGFTGLGAWSNAAGMPYVDWLPMPDLKIGDSGLFDIFHPNMVSQMDTRFQNLAANEGDSNLIGYMFANELRYDKLKTAVPAAGASTGSKLRLVEMLEGKYGGIADFNAAWALNAPSFEALKGLSFAAKTELATRDMDAFTKLYLDELYKQIAFYTKKYDPGHLVMGDRWLANVMNDSKLRDYLAEYAGKYMDVLTYNYYTYDLNLDMLEHLYGLSGGTPFIMTEFHYGDPTTGLTFGARMAENETEKGLMYSNYVEKAAASGYVVGANWFAFLDQAPTGRWFQGLDGEAGAIGLLNVAGRPYRQFLQSVSDTNDKLYDLMLGSIAPYQHTFKPGQTERTSDKKLDVPQSATAPVLGDFEQPWDQAVTANLSDIDLVLGVMKQGIGARMNLTWDDEALYLRAHIDDPTPLSSPNVVKALTVPAAKAYLWAGDAIELFFGPDNVNDGGSMQFSDTQLLLAAAMDEQGVMHTASYWYGYREQEQPPVEMAAELDADGLGYTIEARIAFADIGIDSAADGTVIRYDMGFDEGGAKGRERQFFWNGVDGNSSNREKWGQIVLKAEAPEPPATGGNGNGDWSSASAGGSGILVNGKPADVPVYRNDGNAYEIVMPENGGTASLTVSATELARMASEHPGSFALVKSPTGSYRLPTNWASFVPGFEELLAAKGLIAAQAAFRLTLADAASDAATGQAVAFQTTQGKLLAGVSFTLEVIHAVNGERIAELSEFKLPIVRTVALPTSANGSMELPELYGAWKLEETSGKLQFVPHRLLLENGKASVVISSMTNSTYIVASNPVSFKDVAAGMWYADAIELAASKRLAIGTGAGAFAPSRSVTRAEFARMAANLLQLPAADGNAPSYIDVPKRHAYYDAVSKLSAAGLLSGLIAEESNRFLPDQAITREEMAVIIAAMANALKVVPAAETMDMVVKFTDFASIRAVYADDVRIAYELGVMKGVSANAYEPQGAVSRAQAATVLVRMAERFGFIDEPSK
ncbi:hypothetical protein FHS16_005656 [Paenibacillus endophyticus]|uniref:GH26 domain-containing protein n=1 Tax=Paenibacillus endophyticus TaxID=1294268 RepID=A0A7W5CD65_9BACL|nr:carbohydrate binding domain-containing protein [Paenibacillus endophyticus]MBB3155548.1 hypothetical protein [Paenibacillus endophyticus]